jgi:DNA-3-methyladenine glycosylase II
MDDAIITKAKRHLNRVDPIMADLINAHSPFNHVRKKTNPFHGLVQTIVNQQLSIKAGQTIFSRLLLLQGGRVLKADKIAELTQSQIRNCGISKNKTRSIQTISQAVVNKELNFKKLEKLDDEVVMSELIEYPGIGQWSAEIFLMTSFHRPDILPVGDLVLRKSMQKYYSIASDAHLDDYLNIANAWRPFRTIASRYLWAAYH